MATGTAPQTVTDWTTVADPTDWQTVDHPLAATAAPSPQPEPRTVGNYIKEGAKGVGRGLAGDVKGVGAILAHPQQAAAQFTTQALAAPYLAKSAYDKAPGTTPQRLAAGALAGLENAPVLGPMVQYAERGGSRMASPEAFGAAAEGVTSFEAPGAIGHGVGKLIKAVPDVARAATGTGPKPVADLVKDTQAANEAASAKAAETNTKQDTARKADLNKHFEQTQSAKAANSAAEAGPARKAALTRGVETQDTQFQSDLNAAAKKAKAIGNSKYNAVRKATENQSVPSADLANAVKSAESLVQGSTESLKQFRDILSKHPEGDPGFIQYQGAQIPKGHPLYQVLQQGATNSAAPATFSELQGYYEEIGQKLADGRGTLPSDLYRAFSSLRDSIGKMQQAMAEKAGVGPQFTEARAYYHQYMSAFRDSASPLARAMKATERGKSIGALAGKDQSGIAALAKFDPELARRANSLRQAQAEAKALPSKPGKLKSLPKLPEKPARAVADTKTLGPEDVKGAKLSSLQKQADRIEHRGVWVATWPLFHIMSSLMHGDVGSIGNAAMEGAVTYGAVRGVAGMLRNPKVAEFLTKATPADVAQIPPDLRGQFPAILTQAQKQGIRVAPALVRAFQAGTVVGQTQPGKPGVASALQPSGRDQFMAAPNPKGLVEKGNLPIWNRPTVQNSDGSHSSEYSTSFEDDSGHEVLVPTVVGGKFLTPDGKKPEEGSAAEKAMFKAAWSHYLKSGENLGKFDNPDDADAYAEVLHNRGNSK